MSRDSFGTGHTGTAQADTARQDRARTGASGVAGGAAGSGTSPDRAEVLAILAGLGDRDPSAVGEELGSLELAWLVAETEQRYGAVLDLSEADLDRMTTVDGAVAVLAEVLAGSGAARP